MSGMIPSLAAARTRHAPTYCPIQSRYREWPAEVGLVYEAGSA